MNPDGVSYLDIADLYKSGEWSAALNATWSPLYSGIIGGTFWLFDPSPQWELAVVHVINLVLYLIAFTTFEYFVRVLSASLHVPNADAASTALADRWYWLVLCYALFLWGTLVLVDLMTVTPDMGVVALNFLIGAFILRVAQQPERSVSWLALGVALGLAYLTKAAMFLLAGVSIGSVVLSVRRVRVAAVRGGATLILSFAIVSAPFVLALSAQKGRPTFSDAGKLAYAWMVNDVTPVGHWQGFPIGSGTPEHPPRLLLESPQVYEFRGPLGGTYPVRLDPSYWYEGVRVHLKPLRILRLLAGNIAQYGWLVLPLLLGSVAIGGRRAAWSQTWANWPLLLVSVAGIGMYALVYFESRYVAGLVVILYLAVLGPLIYSRDEATTDALGVRICLGIAAFCFLPVLYHTAQRSFQAGTMVLQNSGNHDWSVVTELRERGLRPGARLAFVGSGIDAYWARLARARIIAEIPDVQAQVFWSCDESRRQYVLSLLTAVGADMVLAVHVPPWADTRGWDPVAGGGMLVASSALRGHVGPVAAISTGASPVDYRIARPCLAPPLAIRQP